MKKIKNLDQCNEALRRIAEIDLDITSRTVARDDAIIQAKHDCDEACNRMSTERDELIDALHQFSDANRDEIIPAGKKSLDLSNGTIGYRQCPDSIEVSAKTAELLIDAGLEHCVKIKKEPVKAALKNMTEADLARYEAKRIPGQESFFATANEIRTSNPKTAA